MLMLMRSQESPQRRPTTRRNSLQWDTNKLGLVRFSHLERSMKKYFSGILIVLLTVLFLRFFSGSNPPAAPAIINQPAPELPPKDVVQKPEYERQRSAKVGDVCTLDAGGSIVFVSMNDGVNTRLTKLCIANDDIGVRNLVANGLVYAVPSGTKARVIQTGFTTFEVRILDGTHAEKAGIVAAEFVKYVDESVNERNAAKKREYDAKMKEEEDRQKKIEQDKLDKIAAEKKLAEDEKAASVLLTESENFNRTGNLKDAIAGLSKLIKSYPATSSNKKAIALIEEYKIRHGNEQSILLLKDARTSLLNGKLDDTAKLLRDLITEYPDSEATKDAKALLAEIEKK